MKSKNKSDWEEWKKQTEEDVLAKTEAPSPVEPVGSVPETVVTETVVTETPADEVPKVDDRFTKKDI